MFRTTSILITCLCTFTKGDGLGAAKEAAQQAMNAKEFSKFMPKPTGHGFDDAGMTREAEFSEHAQMGRFGIPDLANPVAKELTDLDFEYGIQGDKYTAVLFYS